MPYPPIGVQRSLDGLLSVCRQCARGLEVSRTDSGEAIEALVSRAPLAERRALTRRLVARRTMHQARRERRRLADDEISSTPSPTAR